MRLTRAVTTAVGSVENNIVIAAAQSSSVRGDLQKNTLAHLRFIERAAAAGCNLLVFPELSLIGYELDLAASIQLKRDDARLEPIRRAAKKHQMHVVVGGPLTSEEEMPYLGSLIVSPQRTIRYANVHVHESESPYFISGENGCVVSVRNVDVGVAICADTSYSSHAAAVANRGAQLYVASVMKTEDEMPDHAHRMKRHATSHRMAVLTSNYAGHSGGRESAGRSAIWDEQGDLVAQVDSNVESLLVARRVTGCWHGEVIALR